MSLDFENVYSMVSNKIAQEWMAQNLDFTVPGSATILALTITNEIMKMQGSPTR